MATVVHCPWVAVRHVCWGEEGDESGWSVKSMTMGAESESVGVGGMVAESCAPSALTMRVDCVLGMSTVWVAEGWS